MPDPGVEAPAFRRFDGLAVGCLVLILDALVIGLGVAAGLLVMFAGGFSITTFVAAWIGCLLLAVACAGTAIRLTVEVTGKLKVWASVVAGLNGLAALSMLLPRRRGGHPEPDPLLERYPVQERPPALDDTPHRPAS